MCSGTFSAQQLEEQRASQWRGKSRLCTVRFRSRSGSVTPSATRFSRFLPIAFPTQCRWPSRGRHHHPSACPNGGERLVHRRKRLGIVNVRSEIWRGHWCPRCDSGGSATYSLGHQCPLVLTDGTLAYAFRRIKTRLRCEEVVSGNRDWGVACPLVSTAVGVVLRDVSFWL